MAKALALSGTECEGRRLRIEEAGAERAPTVRDPESTTVFVGGINYQTTEDVLAEAFKDCGEIKDIRMPLNDEMNAVRLFCYIINTYLEPWILPYRIHQCRISRQSHA